MLARLPDKTPKAADPKLTAGLSSQSFSGNEEDALFVNDGRGHFTDCAFQARVDLRSDGRAAAWADLDNDGDLDLVVHQLQGPELVVLRNDLSPGSHWLEVALQGVKSNRMGVGGKVTACVAERCQTRWIKAGHGYESQGPAVAHFGLGTAAQVDRLSIEWPSGLKQEIEKVPVDRHVLWVEGQPALRDAIAPQVALGPAVPPALSLASLRSAEAKGPTSAALETAATSGKSVLVNLWSPGCKPCQEEAPILAAAATQCGDQVARVALSTESDLGASQKGAAKLGLSWPIATASEDQLRILDDAIDGIPLPTTLAFDAQGKLTGAIVGKVTPEALAKLAPCAK